MSSAPDRDRGMSRIVRGIGGLGAAALAWLLIGGVAGLLASLSCAAVAWWALGRIEPQSGRRERRRAISDLPLACDLLAAALRAGAPMDRAVGIVAMSIGGPLAKDLRRVRDGLRLGLSPREAWAVIGLPEAARLVDAAVRGVDSGAAVARSLGRVADDLRDARVAAVEAAASRVGVLIVLPLGLCFLPAFVFAGIAPVIVAVLGDVLR
jgi:pilus assembly protein TadC